MMLTIALSGNPNTGKSTIFNALTGAHQHVGNWPGKTVEKKEGRFQVAGQDILLIDLPGTYSLSAFSSEEIIVRDFIIDEHPNAVVAVVDSANLERNLYLVVQLLEMDVPLVIALNMSDVAERRGIQIDRKQLSTRLGGIPVIPMVGNREIGLDSLRSAIAEAITRHGEAEDPVRADFGPAVEREIRALQPLIEQEASLREYPSDWLAIKLIENDEGILARVGQNPALRQAAAQAIDRICATTGDDPDTLIADSRYAFIGALVRDVVVRPAHELVTFSDKVDRILTHRLWGVPIFLALMWLVFQFTSTVSAPFLDFVDGLFGGPVTTWARSILGALGLGGSWVEALVTDGIITGVGGVLVFVPVLASLYLAIALLEDSGYMARAAFVMDRWMSVIGLHGKSFLPLLVGFGCNVPGIYATRTLENEQDRKITGFLTTFMSCGARLPVYVVFGAAFFAGASGTLIFAMYLTGILVAVLTSLLLTRIIFRSKSVPPFVMELPAYRRPSLKTVLLSVWGRTASFIRNAGTIILAASLAIWLLLAIPVGSGEFSDVAPEDSLFGTISGAIAPVFAPAGFGNAEASGALVTGFLAKEAVIATMSQLYVGDAEPETAQPTTFVEDVGYMLSAFGQAIVLSGQELVNIVPRTANLIPGIQMPEANWLGLDEEAENTTALQSALLKAFTPLSAVAFNIFILLYVPCMATVAAMRHEFGARWMLAQVGYTLFVAWLAAVLVYQGGLLLGLGG